MSGYRGKKGGASGMNTTTEGLNDLSDFYACFDCHDFSESRNNLTDRLLVNTTAEENGEYMTASDDEILRHLKRTNPNKAAGPDGIKPSTLKSCAKQLCSILCIIFNVFFAVQNTVGMEDYTLTIHV